MMIKHFQDLHLLLMKSGLFVFMYLSSSVSCLKKNEKVGRHIYQEEQFLFISHVTVGFFFLFCFFFWGGDLALLRWSLFIHTYIIHCSLWPIRWVYHSQDHFYLSCLAMPWWRRWRLFTQWSFPACTALSPSAPFWTHSTPSSIWTWTFHTPTPTPTALWNTTSP